MNLTMIKGKDLTSDLIAKLNHVWKAVYKDEGNKLENAEEFKNNTFFILQESDAVLSVGRLRPITVDFMDKKYNIQGIADIASVIQKKGYGEKVMQGIKNWLKENKEVGIGFCEPEVSKFYEKCGFSTYPGLTAMFWYVDKWSGKLENYKSDVIFFGEDRELINKLLNNPSEKALIPFPW